MIWYSRTCSVLACKLVMLSEYYLHCVGHDVHASTSIHAHT